MLDNFGRTIDYMRISLTDRCNMRCKYCMPHDIAAVSHEEVLRYEEFLKICQAAIAVGINRFKITGGEPLVRKGALDFLAALKKLPGVRSVTLTTNGYYLQEALPRLQQIAVDGINISIDTLDPIAYTRLTGVDGCARVLAALKASVERKLRTKLNVVLLKDNSEQILLLAKLAETMAVDVRFIELMPIGYGRNFQGITEEEALKLLRTRYPDLLPSREKLGNGPAVYYDSKYLQGKLGFIAANTHKFCQHCNRLRLTSMGFLKPCLCYEDGVDLRAILRSANQDVPTLLCQAIQTAIAAKPQGHCFNNQAKVTEEKNMNQIGG